MSQMSKFATTNLLFVGKCVIYILNLRKIRQKLGSLSTATDRRTDIH